MKSPNTNMTSVERAPQITDRLNRRFEAIVLLLAVCPVLFCSCQSFDSGFSRSPSRNNPYAQYDPKTPQEEAYYRDVYSGDWREQTDPTGMGKSIAKKSGSTKLPPHWEAMPPGARTLEEIRAEASQRKTQIAFNSNPYPLPTPSTNYAAASTRASYTAPQVPETPQVALEQRQAYAAPQQQAYAAPQQQTYAAPQQQAYAAPQQTYAAPQQQAYVAPQQAYAAPQQQVYAAPQQQQPAQQVPAQAAPSQSVPMYAPSTYRAASVDQDVLNSSGEKAWIVRAQEPDAEEPGVEMTKENVSARVAARAAVTLDESRPGGVVVQPNVVDPRIAEPFKDMHSAAPNPSAPLNTNAPRSSHDEYVASGGDSKDKVVAHEDWLVENLDPEDSAAHFDTVDGRILTEPANRVFLYSPRFGAVRQIVTPIEGNQRDIASTATTSDEVIEEDHTVKVDVRSQEEKLLSATGTQEVAGAESAMAPTTAIGRVGVIEADGQLRLHQMLTSDSVESLGTEDSVLIMDGATAAQSWSGREGIAVATDQMNAFSNVYIDGPATIYAIKDGTVTSKLRVIKIANKDAARPGEFVEFTLRFENIGDEPIGNVTILDNLSARLRYVDGTAKSSVPADFLADLSDSGSLVLRWEIIEPLQPKEFGVVRFICKVQ